MAAHTDSLLDHMQPEARATRPRIPVLMTVALDQTYDYLVPDGLEPKPGDFVLVPFGPQSRIGVVWDKAVGDSGKEVAPEKLKSIAGARDVPPLPVILLRFAEWIARYTRAPLGMVGRRAPRHRCRGGRPYAC